MNKIGLIGAGNIGGTLANIIAQKNLGSIELIDIMPGLGKGKALDLIQSCTNTVQTINGSEDFSNLSGCNAVIVTAGLARKPGMSRDDLLNRNHTIISEIGAKIKQYAHKDALVIVITNPLDAMVWSMIKSTGFHHSKVIGMAGVLDSNRFASFLSDELKVSRGQINTMVLGGHGDTMVPLIRYCTVAGIPLDYFISTKKTSKESIDKIIQRTRKGGAEIVDLLGTGSAFYAPAASAISMLEAYLYDRSHIFPCCVMAKGHYGIEDDVCVGLPVVLNRVGCQEIIELTLNSQEQSSLDKSVQSTRELISKIR